MAPETDLSALRKEIEIQQEEIRHNYPEVTKAADSVLKIVAHKRVKASSQGSGVVVAGGYVLTANHVIDNAGDILLYTHANDFNLSTMLTEELILVDGEMDLAVFSLPETFEDVVPEREMGSISMDDPEVFLLGFPNLHPGLKWPLYGQKPIIQPQRLVMIDNNGFITTASEDNFHKEFNGASGGALVNKKGEVLGIYHSGFHFENAKGKVTHMNIATNIASSGII